MCKSQFFHHFVIESLFEYYSFSLKKSVNILASSTIFSRIASNITRDTAIVVHRFQKFIINEHQYFDYIKRITRFRIEKICKQHYFSFIIDTAFDRTRSISLFEKSKSLRS